MAATKKKVTKKLFLEMKSQLKTPKDDAKVMKKYGYSQTVVRKIRNTKDWHDYEARTYRFDGYPRKNQPATKPYGKMVNCGGVLTPEVEVEILRESLRQLRQRDDKQGQEVASLRAEVESQETDYRKLKREYMDLRDGFNLKVRAAAIVCFSLGVIFGTCFGIVLELIIKGAL